MENMRTYPYKLPYKLSFNDSRAEVRVKLKPQDAIFKPYHRDVWIFRSHKLIVSYGDDDTVIDITYMLSPQGKIDQKENTDIKKVLVGEVMTRKFKTISSDKLVIQAANMMSELKIFNLLVKDSEKIKGIISMHDILEANVL